MKRFVYLTLFILLAGSAFAQTVPPFKVYNDAWFFSDIYWRKNPKPAVETADTFLVISGNKVYTLVGSLTPGSDSIYYNYGVASVGWKSSGDSILVDTTAISTVHYVDSLIASLCDTCWISTLGDYGFGAFWYIGSSTFQPISASPERAAVITDVEGTLRFSLGMDAAGLPGIIDSTGTNSLISFTSGATLSVRLVEGRYIFPTAGNPTFQSLTQRDTDTIISYDATTGELAYTVLPAGAVPDTIYYGYGGAIPGWKGINDSILIDTTFLSTVRYADSLISTVDTGFWARTVEHLHPKVITDSVIIGSTEAPKSLFQVKDRITLYDDVGNIIIGNYGPHEATGMWSTAVGESALEYLTTGRYNTAFGANALSSVDTSYFNTAVGEGAYYNGIGEGNTVIGSLAMSLPAASGSWNTALGHQAGEKASGDSCVFLGHAAGTYETENSRLYIDNHPRPVFMAHDTTSRNNARIEALVYGIFAGDPADQLFRINADLELKYESQLSSDTALVINPTTGEVGYNVLAAVIGDTIGGPADCVEMAYIDTVSGCVGAVVFPTGIEAADIYAGDTSTYPVYLTTGGITIGRGDTLVAIGIAHVPQDTIWQMNVGTANAGFVVQESVSNLTLVQLSADTTEITGALKFQPAALNSDTAIVVTPYNGKTGYKVITGGGGGDLEWADTTGRPGLATKYDIDTAYAALSGGVLPACLTVDCDTDNAEKLTITGDAGSTSFGMAGGLGALYENVSGNPVIQWSGDTGEADIYLGESAAETTDMDLWIYGMPSLNSDTALVIKPTTGETGYKLISAGALPRYLFIDTTNSNYGIGKGNFANVTSGKSIIALGTSAGKSLTTAGGQLGTIAIGDSALFTNQTGFYNTAIGHKAGYSATGNSGLFIGPFAGYANTGADNTFIGISAGRTNAGGTRNIFIGQDAGYYNVAGTDIVAIGYKAGGTGKGATTLSPYSVFLGAYAGYKTNGQSNVMVGYYAGYENTTGQGSCMIGTYAGNKTTGSYNSFYGAYAGNNTTSGVDNVAIGEGAFGNNQTGSYNAIVGRQAGGGGAGGVNSNSYNSALGYQSLYKCTTGEQNTSMGYQSLYYLTTGTRNVAVGRGAANGTTTGGYNTAVGRNSLYSNKTGSYNVAIGDQAGYYNTLSNRLFIDNQSRSDLAGDTTKALIYGYFDPVPALQRLTFNANVFMNSNHVLQFSDNGEDMRTYIDQNAITYARSETDTILGEISCSYPEDTVVQLFIGAYHNGTETSGGAMITLTDTIRGSNDILMEADDITLDATTVTLTGEIKPNIYIEATEPDIPTNSIGFWKDSDDEKFYLIMDVDGTQKKLELQ